MASPHCPSYQQIKAIYPFRGILIVGFANPSRSGRGSSSVVHYGPLGGLAGMLRIVSSFYSLAQHYDGVGDVLVIGSHCYGENHTR